MPENFWPEFKPANIVDPKSIIEEQARILPKLTGEKVIAIVNKTEKNFLDNNDYIPYAFIYEFYITSKMLPTYKFRVFNLSYNLPIYPLRLSVDSDILKELNIETIFGSRSFDVENEQDLKTSLKLILNSTKVRDVVSSIMRIT